MKTSRETVNEKHEAAPAGGNFNNSGGPRSRVRSERVKVSYLLNTDRGRFDDCYGIEVPENVPDIEAWLLKMALHIGWHGWEDIDRNIQLPEEKHIVIEEAEMVERTTRTVKGILTAALILSMCNTYCYLPNGPRIFTRSRLGRKIMLVKINTEKYYELG